MIFKRHFALCLFLLLLTGFAGAQTFQNSGIIRELSGTVELRASGAAQYVPARVGDRVAEDTVVSTGFRSVALLEIGNALFTVEPLTRLTLLEIQLFQGSETINTFLQTGRIKVDIDTPAGARTSIDVISPMIVASVRGTSFEFDTRTLSVDSGRVSIVGSIGQRISVLPGVSITIGDDGSASNPVRADASALMPQFPVGTEQSSNPVTLSSGADSDDGRADFGVLW
ncbi:MAG: hypothetical protein FWG77_08620 [Treponema sp.]|nr:hypothetical protein [Treponema sp.]